MSKMNKKKQLKKHVVTEDNRREINDAFIMSDSNHKGYLTTKEVCHVIKNLGFNPTDHDCQNMELTLDYQQHGKVGFEGFLDFLSSQYDPEKEEQCLVESFRSFDIDNRGYIPSKDVKEMLMTVMTKCSQQEKEEIIQVFNLQNDRKISYEEFKRMIMPMNLQATEG